MSQHSRNRYVGEHLGRGEQIQEILSKMTMVAEGVPTVKAVYQEMKKYQISMPIVEAVYRVIYENMSAKEMIDRKSTRLNSSHANISYAVFCLKKKIKIHISINRI